MSGRNYLTALVADRNGVIFELDGYAATRMNNGSCSPIPADQTVELPYGSELMLLPDRSPLLYNLSTGKTEVVAENPFHSGEPLFPVAAFNSPGYVISGICAYQENPDARQLPLFSYSAVGWHQGKFRSPVILVDSEPRQDLRQMKPEKVAAGVRRMRKRLPDNRLREHLETCALKYGCPAGKNFFLQRYEAPLPTSRHCNARCLGCLSLQENTGISSTQNRITFTPSPEEIADVALTHIERVKQAVVSFGQGCEGDPLLAAEVIEPAIRIIRKKTSLGTVNMNTNGSKPEILEKLIDAGLDSVRISMNSARQSCYDAYFRPKGYRFSDVLAGIDLAISRNRFVSVNYLNLSGFTDTPEESEAFMQFLRRWPINMIQWRNLNFDPMRYWEAMNRVTTHGAPAGMKMLLSQIRTQFPKLKFGYFNPPKEKFSNKEKRIIR